MGLALILHPVTIDSREANHAELSRALTDRRVPNTVRPLPDNGGGDFRWVVEPETEGQPWLAVTVERKSIADLLTSANDGRLAAFTSTPSTEVALRALLLHGDPISDRQYGHSDMSPEAIDNLLVSVQSEGILVLRAGSGTHALADRLTSFWQWTGKDEHGSYRRPALPATEQVYFSDKERTAVRNLMTIPGWGEQRARDIYRAVGLREVYDSLIRGDTTRLRQVRGVGPNTVKSGIEFLA